MGSRAVMTLFAVAMALTLVTGLAFAKAKGVNLDFTGKLASGPELKPGHYKVEVLQNSGSPEAVFYKGKDVVARAPVKLVEEPTKIPYSEVVYNTDAGDHEQIITEIRLSGWYEKLVFGEPSPMPKTNN